MVDLRIWASGKLVYSTHLPISYLPKAVHF